MAFALLEYRLREQGKIGEANRVKDKREKGGDIRVRTRKPGESPERQIGRTIFQALMENFFNPDSEEGRRDLYGPGTTSKICVVGGEDVPSERGEYQIQLLKPAQHENTWLTQPPVSLQIPTISILIEQQKGENS